MDEIKPKNTTEALKAKTMYLFAFKIFALYNAKYNKTAGNHRRILHLPVFVKKAFEDENVSFLEKHSLFIKFSNFSNVEFFLIFAEKKHN